MHQHTSHTVEFMVCELIWGLVGFILVSVCRFLFFLYCLMAIIIHLLWMLICLLHVDGTERQRKMKSIAFFFLIYILRRRHTSPTNIKWTVNKKRADQHINKVQHTLFGYVIFAWFLFPLKLIEMNMRIVNSEILNIAKSTINWRWERRKINVFNPKKEKQNKKPK